MKKSTKGAVAAGAAAVLLLGGAGSLAYWTASGSADGGDISTGQLKLGEGSCDENWSYAPGSTGADGPVTQIVPGDKVTKTCTFAITASGDHLSATPTVPATIPVTAPSATTFQATADATYNIGGGAVTKITSADNDKTLDAVITVTFPYGDADTINANDTQNVTATLDQLTVTLQQDNPNP